MSYNNKTFSNGAEKATIKIRNFQKTQSFFLESTFLGYNILKF